MATARVIPFEDNVAAQNVNVTSTGALPEGCFLQAGQAITFTNNSGASIDITFVPNPVLPNQVVFNDILGLSPTAPNNTNTQTPQVPNGSVNYNVNVGGTQYGPYAIQVGNGPMYVQITNSVCTPDPVAIPHNVTVGGGTLELVSTDVNYAVGPATFSQRFAPTLTTVGVGLRNNTPHRDLSGAGNYNYTVAPTAIAAGGGGGGTVRVKGS